MLYESALPIVLSIATLAAVVLIGVWQLKRVRHSQAKRGEHPGGAAGPD